MSMPAMAFCHDDDDHPPIDPDDLKMPESPAHRGATDVIGLTAARLLGAEFDVFRDMNWYPGDGRPPLAPDLLVLPAGAMPPRGGPADVRPKSYRQDQTGGPTPTVAVEVPSDSDGFVALRAKTLRCRELGVVLYLVVMHSPQGVIRLAPGEADRPWADRPIPELGGLSIGFDHGDLVVTTPDGLRVDSDDALVAQLDAAAEAARAEAAAAQADAVAARADAVAARAEAIEARGRAEVLAARLRELGLDPDDG